MEKRAESSPKAMDPKDWQRIQDLFDAALDASDAESVLDAEPDPAVSAAARSLLKNHFEAAGDGFLSEPVTFVKSLVSAIEPRFRPEQVLAGRFSIIRFLGQGGMGEVYLAKDQRLDELVAIKTIRSHLAEDAAVRRRFLSEVRNARVVTSRNVCRIFDLFEEGQTPFFAMEYLDGVRMGEWLETARPRPAVARRVAYELASGLHTAHVRGIVHCDFKPSNILMTGDPADPHPLITDFGLARALSSSGAANVHSLLAGTYDYMAPEVRGGAPASIASDIFAFGKVLGDLLPRHPLVAACTSEAAANRPASLEPVIRELGPGISRRTMIGGAVAATLVAGALGYELVNRPVLILAPRQKVLLNGFRGDDSAAATLLRRLVISALQDFESIRILPDDRIRGMLRALNLPLTLPAQRASLHAIAKAGGAFFVEGSVEPVGAGLALNLQVFEPGLDAARLKIREQAKDFKNVLALADTAAVSLRKALGESEASARSRPSLQTLTSSVPEAIDCYLRGLIAIAKPDAAGAAAQFRDAVRLDPQFALAWIELAAATVNLGRNFEALPAYDTAFKLRDRVSLRERLWIEFRYYNIVGDFDTALQTCRQLVEKWPDEPLFQRNIGFFSARTGHASDGLSGNEAAVTLDSSNDNNLSELLINMAQSGAYDETLRRYDDFRKQGYGAPLLNWGAGLAHMGKGDYAAARAKWEDMNTPLELERMSRITRLGPWVMQGRFADAASALEADLSYDVLRGEDRRNTRRCWLGMLRFWMDQPAEARKQLVELSKLDALPIYLHSFLEAGLLARELRDAESLEKTVEAAREVFKKWPSVRTRGISANLEGTLLDLTGQASAGDSFSIAMGNAQGDPIIHLTVAAWQRRQGNAQAALETLRALEREPMRTVRYCFPGLLAVTWIEQARCFADLHEFSDSARWYRKVLDHWQSNAGHYRLVQDVRTQYARALQQTKENPNG